MDTIGKNIRRLRKERDLTQEELAEKLNVSAQAVSKWENEAGLPDISQILPLASVFGVSTDTLFGIEGVEENDIALQIIQEAYSMEKYGNPETYLQSYCRLTEALKKYPSNMILLNNCMRLGLSLSLPENEGLYASERATEIASETIRQAKLIISYSKNPSDIMGAHQTLLMLYSSAKMYDLALSEAQEFPVRTDYTLYSNLSRVYESMGNYTRTNECLCSDIDYSLQALADSAMRLGKSYFHLKRYRDAIEAYEALLNIMNSISQDGVRPSYHDFDSGDCYLLLAQAYLAIGDTDLAMTNMENSILYYLNLAEIFNGDEIPHKALAISPLVHETELISSISKSILKEKLREKLLSDDMKPLRNEERFKNLYNKVQDFVGTENMNLSTQMIL